MGSGVFLLPRPLFCLLTRRVVALNKLDECDFFCTIYFFVKSRLRTSLLPIKKHNYCVISFFAVDASTKKHVSFPLGPEKRDMLRFHAGKYYRTLQLVIFTCSSKLFALSSGSRNRQAGQNRYRGHSSEARSLHRRYISVFRCNRWSTSSGSAGTVSSRY